MQKSADEEYDWGSMIGCSSMPAPNQPLRSIVLSVSQSFFHGLPLVILDPMKQTPLFSPLPFDQQHSMVPLRYFELLPFLEPLVQHAL